MTTKSVAEREVGEMATLLWQHGYAKRTGSYAEERREAKGMAEKLRAAGFGLDWLNLRILSGRGVIRSCLASVDGAGSKRGGGGARSSATARATARTYALVELGVRLAEDW